MDYYSQLFIVNGSIIIQVLFSTTAVILVYLHISPGIIEIFNAIREIVKKNPPSI